jgi:hypothetical protein
MQTPCVSFLMQSQERTHTSVRHTLKMFRKLTDGIFDDWSTKIIRKIPPYLFIV